MNNADSLQDSFLELLRQKQDQVSIYLVNGIKLTGIVDAYNDEVVFLKSNVSQMVYKHAISTVVPSAGVKVSHDYSDGVFDLKEN